MNKMKINFLMSMFAIFISSAHANPPKEKTLIFNCGTEESGSEKFCAYEAIKFYQGAPFGCQNVSANCKHTGYDKDMDVNRYSCDVSSSSCISPKSAPKQECVWKAECPVGYSFKVFNGPTSLTGPESSPCVKNPVAKRSGRKKGSNANGLP